MRQDGLSYRRPMISGPDGQQVSDLAGDYRAGFGRKYRVFHNQLTSQCCHDLLQIGHAGRHSKVDYGYAPRVWQPCISYHNFIKVTKLGNEGAQVPVQEDTAFHDAEYFAR